MKDYATIDADGHVRESQGILEYLEPAWKRQDLTLRSDIWDRSLRGKLGQYPKTPRDHLDAMDQDGINVMVMYPTFHLDIGLVREPGFAAARARAYNKWMHAYCKEKPDRLKFVAVIAPQDPQQAADELRTAVNELGSVGAVLPTFVPMRPDWGNPYFDPIFSEAQGLNVPLGFHPYVSMESVGAQRFDKFINVHTVTFPVEQMISVSAIVVAGVLERFPNLRIAFLESGVGWVPYLMDRLDEEVEKRGEEVPWLKTKPSEYIASGRCFFGVECGEKTISDAVSWGLEDTLLYASDYPHWDSDWPNTIRTIMMRKDLSETTKQKLLHDNAARFYNLA